MTYIFNWKVVFILLPLSIFGQNKNVLIVGNSFLGYNNTPEVIQELCMLNNDNCNIFSFVIGGMNLKVLHSLINSSHDNSIIVKHSNSPVPDSWDFIILQEAPVRLLIEDSFLESIDIIKLFEKMLSTRGKLLIMENYAFSNFYPIRYCLNSVNQTLSYNSKMLISCSDSIHSKLEEENLLKKSFEIIKESTEIEVVGTIEMIKKIKQILPHEDVFIDEYHPSMLLSYLIACKFYSQITDKAIVNNYNEKFEQITELYNSHEGSLE